MNKNISKIIATTMVFGALVSMNTALAETGTLDGMKNVISKITTPIELKTTKPESGNYHTVIINGTKYYFLQSDLPSDVPLKDFQKLISTQSSASGTPIYKIGDTTYSYDTTKLPTSAYKITDGTSSDYNYSKTDGTTTNYYKIDPTTSKAHYTITKDTTNTPDFVIKNLGTGINDGYKITGIGSFQGQITDLSLKTENIGTADSPKVFRELSKTNNHGGAIWNSAVYNHHVYADFVQNHVTSDTSHIMGGAIYNCKGTSYGVIDSIIGDFIGNHANYNGTAIEQNALGGAIYNNQGTISNITGNFVGNYTYTDSSKNSAYGGAISNTGAYSIYTDVIANITGDFIGNYAKGSFNAYGGAISNTTFTKIENITGDFIGNYAAGGASEAQGGAIYNVTSTINNITGDFIGNYAKNDTGACGGAIYNTGTISNIKGNFIGDYVNGRNANGGAIYNTGTISNY